MWKRCILLVIAWSFTGMQSIVFHTHTTSFFRIKYEKTIRAKDAAIVGELLETSYAKFKKIFDLPLSGRVDVTMFKSVDRLKWESKVPYFDDGVFRNGKLFISWPAMIQRDEKLRALIARLTSRVVLDELKGCPHWLAECYSVYAGGDMVRYSRPSRLNMVSFADLAEDFSHLERAEDYRETYGKLAVTASFLVNRYGLDKFESVFAQFKKGGVSYDDAFEKAFGEKTAVIEKAWVKALASPPKEG